MLSSIYLLVGLRELCTIQPKSRMGWTLLSHNVVSLRFQTQRYIYIQCTCFDSPNNLHAFKIRKLIYCAQLYIHRLLFSQRVGHDWATELNWDFSDGSDSKESTCNAGDLGSIPGWGRSPIFLPEKSGWQRNLLGYSPWGRKQLDTTEWLTHSRGLYNE